MDENELKRVLRDAAERAPDSPLASDALAARARAYDRRRAVLNASVAAASVLALVVAALVVVPGSPSEKGADFISTPGPTVVDPTPSVAQTVVATPTSSPEPSEPAPPRPREIVAGASSLSADGRIVAFVGRYEGEEVARIFVRNRDSDEMSEVTRTVDGKAPNGDSFYPVVSSDGTHVALVSNASNLVEGDRNVDGDIFVRDLVRHETVLVSISDGGAQAEHGVSGRPPAVSGDGSVIAFESFSVSLAPGNEGGNRGVYVRDLAARTTKLIAVDEDDSFHPGGVSISRDGKRLAFTSNSSTPVTGDTNQRADVFIHDLGTGADERVSLDNNGLQAAHDSYTPAFSPDGRYLAFTSCARLDRSGSEEWPCSLYVRDLQTDTVSFESPNCAGNTNNCASDRGPTYTVLSRDATVAVTIEVLVGPDPWVRLHDLAGGIEGSLGYASDLLVSMTDDGRYVSYVVGDTEHEAWILDRVTGRKVPPVDW